MATRQRLLAIALAAILLLPGWAATAAGRNLAGAPTWTADGQQTVVATMRLQADLSAISGTDPEARRQGVIRALQAAAVAGQAQLLADLRAERARGNVTDIRPFWVFDGVAFTATADVVNAVRARADVASVVADAAPIVPVRKPTPKPTPSPTATPAPTPTPTPTPTPPPTGVEPNIATVDAPAMWQLGYTGQGVVVASMDSGVDGSHPDLASRFRGGAGAWFDPYGQHPATPIDLTGHGTATMGVIVGGDAGGTAIGMAPGATWIAARIFDDSGNATTSAIHAAFQWAIEPDGDPATADAPQVLNGSWAFSSPGCTTTFQLDVAAIRAAGILPVFAAGNFGPGTGTSASPANYPDSLAVGNVDGSDVVDPASSRGPSSCAEPSTTFPELVAPGVAIRTTERYGQYQSVSGTSIAAPHVTGALALLLSGHPGLSADEQLAALEASADDLGPAGPDNSYGSGRIDVLAAHDWLVANASPPPKKCHHCKAGGG